LGGHREFSGIFPGPLPKDNGLTHEIHFIPGILKGNRRNMFNGLNNLKEFEPYLKTRYPLNLWLYNPRDKRAA